MVPVEQFLLFSRVHPVMLAWLRPMFALTSQFFLPDINEDVEVPPSVLNGQPVRWTEVCFGKENIGPQMTEGTHESDRRGTGGTVNVSRTFGTDCTSGWTPSFGTLGLAWE